MIVFFFLTLPLAREDDKKKAANFLKQLRRCCLFYKLSKPVSVVVLSSFI